MAGEFDKKRMGIKKGGHRLGDVRVSGGLDKNKN